MMENMEMELNVVETPVEENASVVTEVESAEDKIVTDDQVIAEEISETKEDANA